MVTFRYSPFSYRYSFIMPFIGLVYFRVWVTLEISLTGGPFFKSEN